MECKRFDMFQDEHSKIQFLILAANQSFGFWLEMFSVAFIAFVTFSFIVVDDGTQLLQQL